jgi:hypothetical protein
LLKRIDKTISCQSVNDNTSLTKALESVE